MSLNVFLELVEIKAKTASILPMLLGVCLSVYYYHSLNLLNSVLFFIAMLTMPLIPLIIRKIQILLGGKIFHRV